MHAGKLADPASSAAESANEPLAACASAEHRQFDFWLGEWNVHRSDGTFAGRNTVTREHGGCVIHERYTTDRGYSGESLNVYDSSRNLWHKSWADSGGLLLLLEGGLRDGSMVLEGRNIGADGRVSQQRITWTPNADGSVRQLWEATDAEGQSVTVFDGKYTRRETRALPAMKTIGLIGGMSWESTVTYYQLLNTVIRQRRGGLHSAKVLLYSVDFHEIERLQHAGDWDTAGVLLADAARVLERAGADFIVLCTNTMHRVAPMIAAAVTLPLLHIADATAAEIKRAGLTTIGLLGTRFTMEQDFYRGRLQTLGVSVVVPDAADRDLVHRVIYDELCLGDIRDASRERYREIIARLVAGGAQGIVYGCTEIGLLVSAADAPVPVFDTTAIHAQAAVELALA